MNTLSSHARRRKQQRSIPQAAVDLLQDYGTVRRSRGADSYFFDHISRRRAERELGHDTLRGIEKLLNAYAVVSDEGLIITLAWRRRRRHQ